MKITKTKTYNVSFSIVAHEATEGGMDSDFFSNAVSLEDALDKLDIAKATHPRKDWFIKVEADTTIKGGTP